MKKGVRLLRICLWITLAVGLTAWIWLRIDDWRAQREYNDAANIARPSASVAATQSPAPATETPGQSEPSEAPEESPEPSEEPEPLPEEAADLAEIDLAALREVNEDVVGWIEIPGTELSYPVVQGNDNQFYLDNNWKGNPSAAGSIFLESTNERDLSNFHLIIYGHRMAESSNTMFGSLKHYDNMDYWQEHPSVYLVADDGIRRYDIFAVGESSVKGLVYRLDLVKSHLEEDFVQLCVESSVIDTGIIPEADGQFLTLSTCTRVGYDNRWTVHTYLAQVYQAEMPEDAEDAKNVEDAGAE